MSWSNRLEWHCKWRPIAWWGTLALFAFPASVTAAPACVGYSPVEVARWVSKNRPQLAAPDSSQFITSDFLASIRRDNAQAAAQDEICGICGGDLWTNSQEGYARPPKSFRQSLRSGSRAEVIYSMRFSIEDTGPSEPRSARIVLLKERGCWKIDDIVHGDTSIKRNVSGNK